GSAHGIQSAPYPPKLRKCLKPKFPRNGAFGKPPAIPKPGPCPLPGIPPPCIPPPARCPSQGTASVAPIRTIAIGRQGISYLRTIWCPEKRRNGSENLQCSAGAECPASNKANRTLGPLYSAGKNLGNSRRAATSGFANPLVSGRFRVHEKGLEPSKRVRRVLQTGWSRKRS